MKKYSFYELIKETNIRIPIIQRDYVQGRDSHSAKRKIYEFINTMAAHLKKGETLPLNFIYGYKDQECFIPIDGQQRLTTLYLLHLYVFKKAHMEEKIKEMNDFDYRVRPSSNRFFGSLKKNLKCLNETSFENEEPISKNGSNNVRNYYDQDNDLLEFLNNCSIVNMSWFRRSWLNDLTVRSSVIVLYLIKEAFKEANFKEIADKLIDSSNPIICFSYLPMKNVESADETYVKMNARGKQLTSFENFKAELYAFYKDKAVPGLFESFKKEIDSDWLVVALKLILKDNDIDKITKEKFKDSKDERNDPEFILKKVDTVVFSLFNLVQTNNMVFVKTDAESFVAESVFNMPLIDITLKEYFVGNDELRSLSEGSTEREVRNKYYTVLSQSVDDFSLLMDFFKEIIDSSNIEFLEKNLERIWSDEKKDSQHYNERLIVFSLIKFLKDVDGSISERNKFFLQWIKIFRYILNHSEIDKPEKFIKALNNIKDLDFTSLNSSTLYEQALNILTKLKEPFDQAQIKDEINKAEFRIKSSDWETKITKYEKDDYFNGQSIFLGVADTTWTSDQYEKYWEMTKHVFHNYTKHNNALLSLFGTSKYIIELDGPPKSYSFGFYDSEHHKYDWRGIFENEEYVKNYINVLDSLIGSGGISTDEDFENKLQSILKNNHAAPIPNYQTNPDDFLQYFLSQNYNIYDYFKQGRYTKSDGCLKYLLLKNTGTNKDDTIDLSIAYILLKYKQVGYNEIRIDYENNALEMECGAKHFTVGIDSNTGGYTFNSGKYSTLQDVINEIDKL